MKASGNGGIAVVNVNQIAASVIRNPICCEASVRVGWQEGPVKVERAVCDEGSDKNARNAILAGGRNANGVCASTESLWTTGMPAVAGTIRSVQRNAPPPPRVSSGPHVSRRSSSRASGFVLAASATGCSEPTATSIICGDPPTAVVSAVSGTIPSSLKMRREDWILSGNLAHCM